MSGFASDVYVGIGTRLHRAFLGCYVRVFLLPFICMAIPAYTPYIWPRGFGL